MAEIEPNALWDDMKWARVHYAELVGKIKCMIADENENQSKELEIFSYFATTNKVPLLIGFKICSVSLR